MHVCVAWPCLTLYHDTPTLILHRSAPSLSLKHCLHPHTGTHAYSRWTVHAGWVPPCWCTPLNPLACDTSSWNAKRPQSPLSAAPGETDILHISPQSQPRIILILSHTHMHTHAQPSLIFFPQSFFKGRFNSACVAFCRQLLLPLVFIYAYCCKMCMKPLKSAN